MKVSIIIPVYNGANFLELAINSALNQSYKDIEIIVVNDGSNDNGETEKVALSFNDKIKYFYKDNGGVSSSLNYGIQKSNGAYISWLSHDDIYHEDKIKKSIEHLKSIDSGKNIIFTDYKLISETGEFLKNINSPNKIEDVFFGLISNTFALNGCTLLIPKEVFTNIGYFNTKLKTTQDYDMWLRCLKGGYKFINLSENLVDYRIHGNQDSIKKKSLFHKEIKDAQKKVLLSFSIDDINIGSGKKINKHLTYIYLRYLFIKNNILLSLTSLSQKLGFYDFLAPIYRKLFIK
ncbi:glycosyltransferase [Candidatus Gracilibacteria bacterium]|nr:glycosyltransferase [Candidatus Gracilibacteria bacterium]